jgi:hypothetical protein
MPRASYKGEPPEKLGIAAEQAVRDISEALVDCRFLREPMALPADQLKLPEYLRYRLALAVLPSLSMARARFVARIVHRSEASWAGAVADLIRWHSGVGDEAAEWPGRAAQESAISAAGGDGADADGGSDSGDSDQEESGDTADNAVDGGPSKPSGTAG